MLCQTDSSPYLTYWTNCWPKSHRLLILIDSFWWYVSHRVVRIWPNDIFCAKEYSILNFLCIYIYIYILLTPSDDMSASDSQYLTFWTCLAQESTIMNFLYILIDNFSWYISHTVVHIWPNGHVSGLRVVDFEFSNSIYFLLIISHPYSSAY